jgi:hypothetical protein
MLILKEKELCPKSDTCMFAMISGEKCYGACERNSTFVCDLDFATEEVQQVQPLLACAV